MKSDVTFGETNTIHNGSMKKLEWILGEDTVDELYECKILGVLKTTHILVPSLQTSTTLKRPAIKLG